ncbi:NADH-quinone oxidoreductase subunit J family protein [Pontibacter akesuensis]|uniref:NADH-quinone oxidoreductase subunit J n=1 Tax=Pontibacter akesuensis TaxID=388950 RepID=A0A1I7KLL0_9BACT|nr:NADH-quinone oxidoreductase subunit J [Pontibacter akesuensis]GHA77855.1 NADH-quinone oxidoreductase subunit J [Pontibacter akesuensis]SFU98332.1 NADH dehydrogenase subunit J [Pontibacter akesuensis]
MLFYIFAVLAILSAGYMVLTRNLLYAGFSLLITLLSVAGIYVLLFADFVAVVQLMVYVGGVLVLILFGIMLSSRVRDKSVLSESGNKVWGTLVGGLILMGLCYTILHANISALPWLQTTELNVLGLQKSTVQSIGIKLMTDVVVPFELASLLLLIALMGAAYIATDKPKA